MYIAVNMPYSYLCMEPQDDLTFMHLLAKKLICKIRIYNNYGPPSWNPINLLETVDGSIYKFRTGLLNKVEMLAMAMGVKVTIDDNREIPAQIDIPEIEVRDYQEEIIKKILQYDMGVIAAATGTGKRLWIDTVIPTPTGWTTMGMIRVGDKIFDDSGCICHVMAVHPITFGDSYKIVFADGEELIADAEHLWKTYDRKTRFTIGDIKRGRHVEGFNVAGRIVTTKMIMNTLTYKGTYNHSIENTRPLNLPDNSLIIDPYVLGVWLGDGCKKNDVVYQSNEDIMHEIAKAGYSYRVQNASVRHALKMGHSSIGYVISGLFAKLRKVGILNNKHVPIQYLRGSIEQRLSLLQGLLDSDGSTYRNTVEFSNTNKRLADAVYELVVSLGMRAFRKTRTMKNINRMGHKTCFKIFFVPNIPVFRLSRKLMHLKFNGKQSIRRLNRCIISINKVPDVAMRCITVDSPSGLYLAGKGMIPTHNTHMAAAIIGKRKVPTLFNVHTRELLWQTRDKFAELFKMPIGIIGDSVYDIQPITISTIQTLNNLIKDSLTDHLHFGMMIQDECHHLPASMFFAVTGAIKTRYVYGLSATAYRTDGADLMIEAAAGPIVANLTPSESIQKGILSNADIVFVPIVYPMSSSLAPRHAIINKYIVNFEPRNKKIAVYAQKYIDEDKSVLISVNWVKHAEILKSMIPSAKIMTGKTDGFTRDKLLKDLAEKKFKILISTLIKEGCDLPSLDVVINAAGGSDPIQLIGRCLRKFKDKDKAVYVDFIDNQHKSLYGSSMARMKRLKKIKEFNIIVGENDSPN